ncbi:MAG: sulfite exporter TauE/SafE family protein [Phycisphaeraceae bacterium]|nr:sulfite exporter TauE/SafE family protein [Phycisphaeraceae bacterium]
MTPVEFMAVVFAISIAAGVFGSILGLGGGIIVVPALSLWLGVDIRYAIGASIVSVIATSSGAGAAYIKDHMVNIRVGMFLELATTLGALAGAFFAGVITGRWLYLAFGAVLVYTALAMWRRRETTGTEGIRRDRLADALALHASYFDQATGRRSDYRVRRTGFGAGLSTMAGVLSGLLGIGGGIIKVPVMSISMGIPIKVATATSTFMIGVTAAASAGVYFARGDIDPFIAGPTAVGVLCGSLLGARIAGRLKSSTLRAAFAAVLLLVAFQMLRKGLHP